MSTRKCPIHGGLYPCKKCAVEKKSKAPQTPPIPTIELTPLHSQVVVARDYLCPEGLGKQVITLNGQVVARPKDKTLDPGWVWNRKGFKVRKTTPRPKKKPTTREKYNLTRREVAALLDDERVASKMIAHEAQHYRDLAAGNVSMAELAKKLGTSEIGVRVLVEGWEKDIIQHALYFRLPLRLAASPEGSDDFERQGDFDDEAENAIIIRTGGGSINGRIISRGPKMAEGKTFMNEGLDSFERGGQLRMTGKPTGDSGPDRSAPEDNNSWPDFDDYSENSGPDTQ